MARCSPKSFSRSGAPGPPSNPTSRTIVIVSHDQRIRDMADRLLWLEDSVFAEAVELAVDPVCGMSVERAKAWTLLANGERKFFCSRGCRAWGGTRICGS